MSATPPDSGEREVMLREPPEYEALLVRISEAEQLLRQCDEALTMAKIQLSQNDEGCLLVDRALMGLARFRSGKTETPKYVSLPPPLAQRILAALDADGSEHDPRRKPSRAKVRALADELRKEMGK